LTPDFLICGGGVIGCATALELATAGASVTVLERGTLGRESSWSGAGLLYPLLPWNYREEVTRLTASGRARYPAWIAGLQETSGVDPGYRQSGLLVLPPYDRERAFAWAAAHHESMAEISPRLVEPVLGENSPALWLPEVAQVRNPRLMRALRIALEHKDVMIHENVDVGSWRKSRDRIEAAVTTEGQAFSAGTFIVAAGPWTPGVLGVHGAALAIKPIRGQMLLYKLEPDALRRIVLVEGTYMIPRDDGHLLVGSTLEDVGFDKNTTSVGCWALKQKAERILPALKGVVPIRHWAGLRPGSPENIPTIARHPQLPNLWVSSGHYRYGVTMAPASAQLLADMLLGRPPMTDPAPYAWPG
jgi:glycine oxidase